MLKQIQAVDDALDAADMADASSRGFDLCPKCGKPDVFCAAQRYYASCKCRTSRGCRNIRALRRYWNGGSAAIVRESS